MKKRPIIFDGPMACAILEGRKTMTRRIINPQPHHLSGRSGGEWIGDPLTQEGKLIPCPLGKSGDKLWVKETWAFDVNAQASLKDEDGPFVYAADGKEAARCRIDDKWRYSVCMPQWASRIILEIISVRAERLQSMSGADAMAEGVETEIDYDTGGNKILDGEGTIENYRAYWNSRQQHSKGFRWEDNPWVWVVEFKRVRL